VRKVRTSNEHGTYEGWDRSHFNVGERKLMESATENNYPPKPWQRWEKMKTCGKSARLCIVISITGKPYQKQDKKACIGGSFRSKHAGMSHR
jgi:hypothetical protein